MLTRYLHWLGLIAAFVLIISCFMPWAYYSDIHQTFTGFYSYQNHYGKPGILLSIVSLLLFTFMLLPKIWAKRANLFIAALGVGYAIKTYVLFTSCYNTYCPDKKAGIFLMVFSMIVLLIASIFPDLSLDKTEKEN